MVERLTKQNPPTNGDMVVIYPENDLKDWIKYPTLLKFERVLDNGKWMLAMIARPGLVFQLDPEEYTIESSLLDIKNKEKDMDKIDEQKVARVLAHLIKQGGVDPQAIENAVLSAQHMKMGEQTTTLEGGSTSTMRRVFVYDMTRRLKA